MRFIIREIGELNGREPVKFTGSHLEEENYYYIQYSQIPLTPDEF